MLVPGETIPPFLTSSYYTEPYHQNIKLKWMRYFIFIRERVMFEASHR